MELVALLSTSEKVISEVKRALDRYTVYPVKTVAEIEDLNMNMPLNLMVIDTSSFQMSVIEDSLLTKLEDDMVVLITSEKPDAFTLQNLQPSVYCCVESASIVNDLPVFCGRAIERRNLKNELRLLRKIKDASNGESRLAEDRPQSDASAYREPLPSGRYLQEKVLMNFAKMLTAGFDIEKLFNHFMDSVMEIARVSKMSVMLRDEQDFYVKTHTGLDPYIADNLSLKKDSSLVSWLTKTGRIIHKPVIPEDTVLMQIRSEMDLLQCSYSFPMIYKGKLIGIFNINNKITEEPFYREELEMIYMFCNYLAAAVKDIDLYNQILYQKEFTKNILSSMNSGVIAIDKSEKITIFNQMASEILNLESSEISGKDLRILPSPLGDILYETMKVGTSYKRFETEIHMPRVPLGINSYRLVNEHQEPIGAGIVFTDLTDSKKLEEQKRKTEKLEAMNELMAKIAHEIRTPLTSIQTYTQLLSEKYGVNEALQNFFATTVIQSIYKLDILIDKLIIFSSKDEYALTREDINFIIDESSDYILKNISREFRIAKEKIDRTVLANVDRKFIVKAIFYIILNIIDRSPEGALITIGARLVKKPEADAGIHGHGKDPNAYGGFFVELLIKYSGSEITDQERQSLLSPLSDISNLGTELNVPISQKIIHGHDGTLEIRSEEGNNIFIIRLPVVEISEARAYLGNKTL